MLKGMPLVSGIYSIEVPQTKAPAEVYCDLETAGGGWLLAGRSTSAGAPGQFGWRSESGSLFDDIKPYSLGFHTHPFAFAEILVGARVGGKSWGDTVYKFGVPSDLLQEKATLTPADFDGAVLGSCEPDAGPAMLRFVGLTEHADAFFFRDMGSFNGTSYGLRDDQFFTLYENCEKGGLLMGSQGMIMVR